MEQLLDKERSIFEAHINEWRKEHAGEFVLIKEEKVIGFFPSLDKAFTEGTRLFGTASFFVKAILPKDRTNISFLGKSLRSA